MWHPWKSKPSPVETALPLYPKWNRNEPLPGVGMTSWFFAETSYEGHAYELSISRQQCGDALVVLARVVTRHDPYERHATVLFHEMSTDRAETQILEDLVLDSLPEVIMESLL